jgi:hypothetical protein
MLRMKRSIIVVSAIALLSGCAGAFRPTVSVPASIADRNDLIVIIDAILGMQPPCNFDESIAARLGTHAAAVCMLAGSKLMSVRESTLIGEAVEVSLRSSKGSEEVVVLTHSAGEWRVESVWIIDGSDNNASNSHLTRIYLDAAPDADRNAVITGAILLRVRSAPVSGGPLGGPKHYLISRSAEVSWE